ncbi:MAG: primosomal protein N' [Gammaproteobacteria bacterium]|nr:primosomal protein N' [Gammaproteobacteria bacterium]
MPKPDSFSHAPHASVILRLAVPSPLRRLFDYLPPLDSTPAQLEQLQPGVRISVPFGSRTLVAVLVSTQTQASVEHAKLRHATAILDQNPLLPQALMELYLWAAQYYQHPPGEVFSTMLPALLRQGRAAAHPGRKVWRLSAQGRQLDTDALRRAPRQREILEFLTEHEELDRESIAELEISPVALSAMAKAGFVETSAQPRSPRHAAGKAMPESAMPESAMPEKVLQLNAEQLQAVNSIRSTIGSFGCYLLDGVTGSGKTEVYLQVIAEVLRQSRQALVLVPEISLTPQTISRFRKRFQCRIAVLHSGLTDAERLQAWLEARDGQAEIVIGTRSALFTPLARPGIIIIDEEHDGSFKQQDGFRYSARDLAIVRARNEDIGIVLGSATPSLETLHNALTGRYQHLLLTERAGIAERPALRLLDTTNEVLQEGFSAPLLQDIADHLQRGNQVLMFLNRRGFAPTLQCADCGWVAECLRCDARLTLHKTPPHLRCHHCDARKPVDRHCPQCKSKHLQALGLGTERSEGVLASLFPDTRVLRVDRDTTRRKNELNALLNEVHRGEPCILIGTQMLAKGHHFPCVTLVAVLDADAGLFSADFRGQEHTAQLLMQVAGRAGRAGQAGEVVIQTRHANHNTLQALVQQGYGSFARTILKERQAAGMPPFSHLALIRAEATDFRSPEQFLALVRQCAERLLGPAERTAVTLMGPLPAPMEKRAGKFRAQLLLQSAQRSLLQNLLSQLCPALESMKESRSVRWSVDVDPQDMI